PTAAPPSARRVVIAQPEGAEPAYPGQVGPEVSPVSEELLHRAIRSNIELAEALGQVVRDVSQGLAIVQAQAGLIAGGRVDAARAATTIEREVVRLNLLLKELGQSAAGRTVGQGRAPAPPQSTPTPARGLSGAPPPPAPVPAAQPASAPAHPPAPPAAAAPASLDGLVVDVLPAVRSALAARGIGVESRIARGAALPRCSPAALRQALAGLLQGLAAAVSPSSGIVLRAEKKPVLLRGRDGREAKRDFLMIALTHTAGLGEADQQRILKGGDTGPLGEAHRLVREMGGFLRFAPLPGAALETRVFLPA
ncbi:MAG TPA: hypothetical protein VML50_04590, partial [Anaeromyxobacter sp.]|nr:hypothetical protein [Anaeromyxobacter sp.]